MAILFTFLLYQIVYWLLF